MQRMHGRPPEHERGVSVAGGMIEVRHLEIVDAIARAGSVTAAARRLHLTQPAVSHALADLEGRLGVSLFRRKPRGMEITPEGTRLADTARVVLDQVRDAEADLRLFRDGHVGSMRIATECYTCYHWLPPILAHFQERFPEVAVQIATEATDDPIGALVDETLDAAIVHTAVEHPDLVSEVLYEDELLAAVPPSHPLASRQRIEPSDFSDQVLLLHSDPGNSVVVQEFLEPAGVRPLRILELRLTEALIASVMSGLGVTVMASWVLRPRLDAGELVGLHLGRGGLHRTWRLVTRRDRARRATIQELARLLKDENGLQRGSEGVASGSASGP